MSNLDKLIKNGENLTSTIKNAIIQSAVDKFQDSGYADVNKENILTDYVYAKSFKGYLEENRGKSDLVDQAIVNLLDTIDENQKVLK